jgi:hypothetical protein
MGGLVVLTGNKGATFEDLVPLQSTEIDANHGRMLSRQARSISSAAISWRP